MPRVTITVPEKTPQPYRFQLDRQVVSLGRGSENDIPIDCGSVSVKHAEMRRVGGGYELRDAGSTNGIKLYDERYEVIPLRNGISVRLGDVAFDFMLTDEEQEALSLEKPDAESPPAREPDKSLPKLPPIRSYDEPQPLAPVPMPVYRDISGYAMLLLFMLALCAFFVGMSVRFRKETHGSLMDAIKAHRKVINTPAKKAPAPTKAPTPAAPATTAPATTPAAPAPVVPATPAPDPTPPAAVPDATPPATDPATTPPATDPGATPPATDPGATPPATDPGAVPPQ